MKKETDTPTYQRGERPSLVESFEIAGLYDYRKISLASPYAATILIAQNGSGKTTLLGALDAFLKGQFSRLRDVPFRKITCKLRGELLPFVLQRAELDKYINTSENSEIGAAARRFGVDPRDLLRALEKHDWNRLDYRTLREDPVYEPISKHVGYRYEAVHSALSELKPKLFQNCRELGAISSSLHAALSNIEVLYLPTYRRIELSISAETDNDQRESLRRLRSQFRVAGSGLYPADIQFGLGDISERLLELNQRILIESNQGYRQITADILSELIDNPLENIIVDDHAIPSKTDLELFLSRLKEVGRYVGRFPEPMPVPNIEKLYSSNVPAESNKFLRYFLGKLNSVINATRAIELPVEEFVQRCNKYLSATDISTSIEAAPSPAGLDGKVLHLDRRSLKVYAKSISTGRRIKLDALSSGEKQMVSLFAKLFLFPPHEKLILIDEPELSLSLDWQRHILSDIVDAPLCRQVIAITHSPFVFDNELEPFARSVQLSVDEALPSSAGDEGESEIDD
ncbi:AAA family ATPase [Ferrovibrio sp.]|uniref:AAA family ATPase n=1 Tax=Ferrovibrio sp. TaxID=1917215 RepID=UPI003517F4A1